MRTTILKSGLLALIIAFSGVLANVNGQEEYRRFSLTLNGGVTLADQGGVTLLTGFMNRTSDPTPYFGGSLGYAITPYWNLDLGGRYVTLEGNDFDYETSIIAINLTNTLNLNQLFATNTRSRYVNPFVTLGVGLDMIDYEGPDRDFDQNAASLHFGFGFAFYLSRTVDFLVEYQHKVSSNRVDNLGGGALPSDHMGMVGAGLRFNFGAANARHASWRRAPMDLTRDDYNRLMALADRVDDMERRQSAQADQISSLESELASKTSELSGRLDDHESRISDLESRYRALDSRVRDLEERPRRAAPVDDAGLTQELPDGHYVQIFAALSLEHAQRVRRNAINMLDGVIENRSEMVLITKRRQFYEVRIGVFDRFSDTVDVLRTAQGTYSDAFVVTFPRPAHLRSQYEDIRRAQ